MIELTIPIRFLNDVNPATVRYVNAVIEGREIGFCHDDSDLDEDVIHGVEAGHFAVDPNQAFLWPIGCPISRARLRQTFTEPFGSDSHNPQTNTSTCVCN